MGCAGAAASPAPHAAPKKPGDNVPVGSVPIAINGGPVVLDELVATEFSRSLAAVEAPDNANLHSGRGVAEGELRAAAEKPAAYPTLPLSPAPSGSHSQKGGSPSDETVAHGHASVSSSAEVAQLAEVLEGLHLTGVSPELRRYGVKRLEDLSVLLTADLEEIGLSRVQIRTLQREVEKRVQCASSSAIVTTSNVGDAAGTAAGEAVVRSAGGDAPEAEAVSSTVSLRIPRPLDNGASESAPGGSRHSRSRSQPRRPRSCSAHGAPRDGLLVEAFEQASTDALVSFVGGRGEEVAPRSLGLTEADLALRLLESCMLQDVLPPGFRWVDPSESTGKELLRGSLLLFEMKSSARNLEKAFDQLRRRFALIESKEPNATHLVVVVASPVDDSRTQSMLLRAAQHNRDVHIVAVDVQELNTARDSLATGVEYAEADASAASNRASSARNSPPAAAVSGGDARDVDSRAVCNSKGYPLRVGSRDCDYYLRNDWCAYGAKCRFNHPEAPPNLRGRSTERRSNRTMSR